MRVRGVWSSKPVEDVRLGAAACRRSARSSLWSPLVYGGNAPVPSGVAGVRRVRRSGDLENEAPGGRLWHLALFCGISALGRERLGRLEPKLTLVRWAENRYPGQQLGSTGFRRRTRFLKRVRLAEALFWWLPVVCRGDSRVGSASVAPEHAGVRAHLLEVSSRW